MKMFVPDGKGGREELKVFRGDPGPQGDRGPQGEPGPPGKDGKPGTTSWSGITDKPSKFTPDSHKHTMADISDLPPVENKVVGGTIVKRFNSGVILVPDPATSDSATPKSYVDSEVGKKADTAHKHTTADISDLPPVSDAPKGDTLVVRSASGAIRAAYPQGPNNVATQQYVDNEVAKKADASHTHSEYATRADLAAAIRLVSSPPSSPTSGVLYVIPEA